MRLCNHHDDENEDDDDVGDGEDADGRTDEERNGGRTQCPEEQVEQEYEELGHADLQTCDTTQSYRADSGHGAQLAHTEYNYKVKQHGTRGEYVGNSLAHYVKKRRHPQNQKYVAIALSSDEDRSMATCI